MINTAQAAPPNAQQPASVPTSFGSESVISQLEAWSNEASIQSIELLETYLKQEENEELSSQAELFYQEAIYQFYQPVDQEEERLFLIAKIIYEKEHEYWDILSQIHEDQFYLKKIQIEVEITKQYLYTQKGCEYNESDAEEDITFYTDMISRLHKEVERLRMWIDVARVVLTGSKYEHVSQEVCETVLLAGEPTNSGVDNEVLLGLLENNIRDEV